MSNGRTYVDRNGETFRAYQTSTGWRLIYSDREVFVGLR